MSDELFGFSPIPLTTPERARDIARTLAGSALRLAELGAAGEARLAESRSSWWLAYALVLDRANGGTRAKD
jgi:hypothetical protein